ncbi:MAG TPA: GYD domain-containing protein [Dehalococcoidales bacterium]|nr:GYD domain-containing protein [Dehalococcoidales bacterium]
MALYIMMSSLTDEGRKTVKSNPARIKEVNKEVEQMGIKVLAQYVVLGQYDFINILEAPNNEAVARMALELGSRGTLTTNTLAALTLDDFIKSVRK